MMSLSGNGQELLRRFRSGLEECMIASSRSRALLHNPVETPTITLPPASPSMSKRSGGQAISRTFGSTQHKKTPSQRSHSSGSASSNRVQKDKTRSGNDRFLRSLSVHSSGKRPSSWSSADQASLTVSDISEATKSMVLGVQQEEEPADTGEDASDSGFTSAYLMGAESSALHAGPSSFTAINSPVGHQRATAPRGLVGTVFVPSSAQDQLGFTSLNVRAQRAAQYKAKCEETTKHTSRKVRGKDNMDHGV